MDSPERRLVIRIRSKNPGAMVARVRGSATIWVHYYAHITLKFSGDILEGYESLRLITIFFPT